MAQAFPQQQQQQQQQQTYMGGQFPEYAQQPRYGGVPHAAYGVLPYAAVPSPQYLPQGMPAPDGGYHDADTLALAQGMNNMVLGPGQQQMVQIQQGQYYAPHQQQRMPAGYGPPAGYGYPPQGHGNAGLRGPQLGQQQYQQHPGQQGMGPPMGTNGHHLDMRGGPMQNGRGGPGPRMMGPGPGPRGMGMQQQQQQMQRGGGRKKVQRGLEDNVKRTVYISYIDQQVRSAELRTCAVLTWQLSMLFSTPGICLHVGSCLCLRGPWRLRCQPVGGGNGRQQKVVWQHP
jgi:hypothetical protein